MSKDVVVDFLLNLDESDFNSSVKKMESSVSGFIKTAAPIAAGSAILGKLGKAATSMAIDFEQSFSKVSTLFGDVEVDTGNLQEKILDLSTTTGIAATELNEGLYSALSAGIPVTEDMSEAIDFLTQATKLSVAGFTSVDKAVDVTTSVLNAYGLEVGEAERVMNTLIETQNAGKTTVDELASSIGKAIPAANALGVNFEELSASLAVMTANGINTAESVTAMKALLSELTDTTSLANDAFKTMTDTTVPEFIANGGSLQEVLVILNDYLEKNNGAWLDILSSSESVMAAQTLMKDGGESLAEVYARMTDDVYELNGAYEQMQTPAQNIAKIQEGFKNALIETGEGILNVLSPALEILADNIEWIAPLVTDLVAAVGGLLIVIGVAYGFSMLNKALGLVKVGLTTLTTAMGPVGIAITAGIALFTALNAIFPDLLGNLARFAQEGLNNVKAFFSGVTTTQYEQQEIQKKYNEDYHTILLDSEELFRDNKNKKTAEWNETDLNQLRTFQNEQIRLAKEAEEDKRAVARQARDLELVDEAEGQEQKELIADQYRQQAIEADRKAKEDQAKIEELFRKNNYEDTSKWNAEDLALYDEYLQDQGEQERTAQEKSQTADEAYKAAGLSRTERYNKLKEAQDEEASKKALDNQETAAEKEKSVNEQKNKAIYDADHKAGQTRINDFKEINGELVRTTKDAEGKQVQEVINSRGEIEKTYKESNGNTVRYTMNAQGEITKTVEKANGDIEEDVKLTDEEIKKHTKESFTEIAQSIKTSGEDSRNFWNAQIGKLPQDVQETLIDTALELGYIEDEFGVTGEDSEKNFMDNLSSLSGSLSAYLNGLDVPTVEIPTRYKEPSNVPGDGSYGPVNTAKQKASFNSPTPKTRGASAGTSSYSGATRTIPKLSKTFSFDNLSFDSPNNYAGGMVGKAIQTIGEITNLNVENVEIVSWANDFDTLMDEINENLGGLI